MPGNSTFAANLMARAWNFVTLLQTATTLGAAKSVTLRRKRKKYTNPRFNNPEVEPS